MFPVASRKAGKGLTALACFASLVVSGCSHNPGLADLDVANIESPAALTARYNAEFASCMADAGYPDFKPDPLGETGVASAPIPLNRFVEYALADAHAPASADTGVAAYLKAHAMSLTEADAFSSEFIRCDDQRAQLLSSEDSSRSGALQVLNGALTDLYDSPSYIDARTRYISCMRAKGWVPNDAGRLGTEIMDALYSAVSNAGDVHDGGRLGFVGAEFDADGIARAQEIQDQMVTDDETCGADTLAPATADFTAEYGPLYTALTGGYLGPDHHVWP